MDTDDLYDFLAQLIVLITGSITLGVAWMWNLYFGRENIKPRSRFLFVLTYESSVIMVALWALTWLAARRLQNEPSLGVFGGLILVGVILILAVAPLITIVYLFLMRRLRYKKDGYRRPPPFSSED